MTSISNAGLTESKYAGGSIAKTSDCYNPEEMKSKFPIFRLEPELAYLDSAATSQKPDAVIERIVNFYQGENANVHRGVYQLSEMATLAYEQARMDVADFIGCEENEEVVFTSGTTESLNLVAHILKHKLKPGDEIVLTISEHHSNIVPWQLIAAEVGAKIRFIPLTENWRLDLEEAEKLITNKTKVVSCAHVSNVIGVIHPIKKIISIAKNVGAFSVIDGAQGVPHLKVNVNDLGCDFYTFSGHKMLGPTGIGVLWGRHSILADSVPYKGGGDMIRSVTINGSTWNDLPYKFEAGTPNIAGVVGLAAAVNFLNDCPRDLIRVHDYELGFMLHKELSRNKRLKLFCHPDTDWLGIVSFHHETIHPHDMASIADNLKVCIRAGHHCAHPLMQYLKVAATSRVSPFIYNTKVDIERFFEALDRAEKLLGQLEI